MDNENSTFSRADFDFIKTSLKRCLPSSNDDKLEEWALNLARGSITEDVASYVSQEDLVQHGLNIYQARALADHWKGAKHLEQAGQQAGPSGVSGNSEHRDTNTPTLIEFTINWRAVYNVKKVIKGKLHSADTVLKNNQRPHPDLRCKIVEEVVNQAIEKIPNVNRKSFEPIAEVMLAKHRASLGGTVGKNANCNGGLLDSLKNKFDNSKRLDRNGHHRTAEALKKLYEQPRGKYAYGCVRWRAKDLPDDQTAETVAEQQSRMQTMYSDMRPSAWDWEELKTMLSNTYKEQRTLINKNIEAALAQEKSKRVNSRKRKRNEETNDEEDENLSDSESAKTTVYDVYRNWPYLFTFDGMLHHYKELTGVDAVEQIGIFCQNQLEAHLKCFESFSDDRFYVKTLKNMRRAKERDALNEHDVELRAVMIMISNYLGEENPFKCVEESATFEALEKNGPVYPGVIVPAKKENLFKGRKFFVGTDSELYITLKSFKKALLCTFMLYFVFNLDYAPLQQVTLEYLQRCMFHVDPVRGNKRPSRPARDVLEKEGGDYSSRIVHPNVARLAKKVSHFDPQAADSDTTSTSSSAMASASEDD